MRRVDFIYLHYILSQPKIEYWYFTMLYLFSKLILHYYWSRASCLSLCLWKHVRKLSGVGAEKTTLWCRVQCSPPAPAPPPLGQHSTDCERPVSGLGRGHNTRQSRAQTGVGRHSAGQGRTKQSIKFKVWICIRNRSKISSEASIMWNKHCEHYHGYDMVKFSNYKSQRFDGTRKGQGPLWC